MKIKYEDEKRWYAECDGDGDGVRLYQRWVLYKYVPINYLYVD